MISSIFFTLLNLTTSGYFSEYNMSNMDSPNESAAFNDSSSSAETLNYWALSLLSIPAATLFGNILVITSVCRFRSLQSPINYFILGLAVADLMLAAVVMPFAVYVEFRKGLWQFGDLACDLYCAADVTCSTASIFLLTIISFDRYVAATKPIKYANSNKGVCHVTLINLVAWLVSSCIASPMVLGLNNVLERDNTTCRFYNADFIIYSSTGSFCIPLVLIIYLYACIYRVIKRRSAFTNRYQPQFPTINTTSTNNTAACIIENTKVEQPLLEKVRHRSGSTGSSRSFLKKAVSCNSHAKKDLDYLQKYKYSAVTKQYSLLSPKRFASLGHPISLQNLNACACRQTYCTNCGNTKLTTSRSAYSAKTTEDYLSEKKNDLEKRHSLTTDYHHKSSLSGESKADTVSGDRLLPPSPIIGLGLNNSRSELMIDKDEETKHLTYMNNGFAEKSPETIGRLRSFSDRSKSSRDSINTLDSSNDLKPDEYANFQGVGSAMRLLATLKTAVVVAKKTSVDLNIDYNNCTTARKDAGLSFKKVLDMRKMNRKLCKSAKREKKATNTLAIVLGVFLICWGPFFTMNLLNAICIKFNFDACQVGLLPFTLTTWLGYMNSFMNPIIYTIFNLDFRRAFKQLLFSCFLRKPIRRMQNVRRIM